MRRMPDDRRLSTLVRAGAPVRDQLRDLARSVAAFHAAAGRGPEIDRRGQPRRARRRWAANVDAAAGSAARVLATGAGRRGRPAGRPGSWPAGPAVRRPDRRRAHRRRPRRPARRRHLLPRRRPPRPGLPGVRRPAPLRRRPRRRRVPRHGPGAARPARPRRATSWTPTPSSPATRRRPPLRHHYVAYRAFVRAKVACLRHQQGDAAAAATRRSTPTSRCGTSRPGPCGSRWSAACPAPARRPLAGALADRFGAVLLSSDRLRKELAGLDPDRARAAALTARASTPPERTDELYARAAAPGRGSCWPAASRWCSTRRGPRRRIARPRSDWRRHRTATWCTWSAAPAPSRCAATQPAGPTPRTPPPRSHRACRSPPTRGREAVPMPTSGPLRESLDLAAAVWRGVDATMG